jgi:hypothetical protein
LDQPIRNIAFQSAEFDRANPAGAAALARSIREWMILSMSPSCKAMLAKQLARRMTTKAHEINLWKLFMVPVSRLGHKW